MNDYASNNATDQPISINNKANPDVAVFTGAAPAPTAGASAGAGAGSGGGGLLQSDNDDEGF